jgi:hypothetical protein
MRNLPELPQKYHDAFESARAKAELGYATRADKFPHNRHLTDNSFFAIAMIQTVFFEYCTQVREACRNGKLSLAQVSNAVDAAWPAICDHYVERERGAGSDEERSKIRVSFWKLASDEPQWKRHLSEVDTLAGAAPTVAPSPAPTASTPGSEPTPANSGHARRPSRQEIEKFAQDRFDIARETILKESAEKKIEALRAARLTGNAGSLVPALVKWGSERVRETILAYAAAYVEAFALYGVPSDLQAETDLRSAAQQFAAGTIPAIRGEIDLTERRTGRPRSQAEGHVKREIEKAMNLATKAGVHMLRRQRVTAAKERLLRPELKEEKPTAKENVESHETLPEPPSKIGGRPTVASPRKPKITGPIDHTFPTDFPESSHDRVKTEERAAARDFNTIVTERQIGKELRANRLACTIRVARVFGQECRQFGWGVARTDSEVREFFASLEEWAGLATGYVAPEVRRELDEALNDLLDELLQAPDDAGHVGAKDPPNQAEPTKTKDRHLILLEAILEQTTVEKWAHLHRVGRTTVFDWLRLRRANQPIKGKVGVKKNAAIESAIEEEAEKLGLTPRTSSD